MSYDWGVWSYLYHDKKPIGRERKYCLLGEHYSTPEIQDTRVRSCFYKKDQSKIGKLQTKFPVDRFGRKIFFGIDRVIVLMANHEPLLIWKPLYLKGQTLVMECLNPGYTKYRCMKKASDVMVITDQLRENYIRENQEFELIAVNRNNTSYQLKD